MTARRLWVLLVLASVFSMHGVQCAVADLDAGHGMSASAQTPEPPPAERPPVAMAMAVAAEVTPAMGPGVVHRATGDGLPSHDASLSAVCLAILLTGVALLGLVALIRQTWSTCVRARAPSPRRRAGWSQLVRPPDLSALCLLRI